MSVNNSLFCNGILTHGTEDQKQLYVRAIAEGREIGAWHGSAWRWRRSRTAAR